MIEEIKIDRLEELIQEMMEKIRNTYPTATVEGNPIEITNGADAPLVKCVTQITGYQSGSGTPSPDNIRPIVAYTEGEIEVSDGDGNTTTHTTTFPTSIYRGSEDVVNGEVTSEKKVIELSGSASESWVMTAGDNYYQFHFVDSEVVSNSNMLCNMFELITTSERSTKIGLVYNNDSYFRVSLLSSFGITTVEQWKTFLSNNNLQIVADRITPTTSSVTPTNLPIKSLLGYNHIESSTGDMEVEYIRKHFQGIVNLIPEIKVNPSGEATATLSKLEVDDVVYGLPE